ncbi:ABC transporter permease [Alkalicoccus urumqiensis]|uniref:Uncharacterized protein n=1 Tax=Alkalicoccus urumqiensis TaxID=1548213 RepID=A0A2P6MJ58_ALKUR|nr:ABC transporter permease [Alkalicoccus urumqiensis]PRO66312.1 hypothetical protein C6I21_05780 [Alkalicoccus urumqiensis]
MKTGKRRIVQEWAYHLSVWRLVIDWTVALYLVVPAAVIGGWHYWQFVEGQMSHWFSVLPPERAVFLWIAVIHSGTFRWLVMDADLLFHRRFDEPWEALQKTGIRYSLFLSVTAVLSAAAVIVPALTVYAGEPLYAVLLFLPAVLVLRMTGQLVQQKIDIRFERWRRTAVAIFCRAGLTVPILAAVFFGSYGAALLFLTFLPVLWWLLKSRRKEAWAFPQDCQREAEQRMKYSSFLLQLSGFHTKQKKEPRRKPLLLFTQSGSLFRDMNQELRLFEWLLKRWLRSRAHVFLYLQLTVVFSIALAAAPGWVKWVLLPVCSLIVVHTTYQVLGEAKNHPFFQLICRDASSLPVRPFRRAVGLITTPAVFLFGFITGAVVFQPLAGLLLGAAAALLLYLFYTSSLLA